MPRRNENARKVHKGRSNKARREELAFLRPGEFAFTNARHREVFRKVVRQKEPSDSAA